MVWFTFISKGQSDIVISQGFYFHETSHVKFPEKKTHKNFWMYSK